jgi:hypothetical protein
LRIKRIPILEAGVYRVPLGPQARHGYALMDQVDLEFLTQELGLSDQWNMTTGGVCAPCARAPGAKVSVARVLLDCSNFEQVRYRSGDTRDLRRSNLILRGGPGTAKHNARKFLYPKYELSGEDAPFYR